MPLHACCGCVCTHSHAPARPPLLVFWRRVGVWGGAAHASGAHARKKVALDAYCGIESMAAFWLCRLACGIEK